MTQPGLQYPNGSNLGILRSNDNYYIPVTVPNSSPQSSPITYSLINATSSSTQLPPNLRLDSSSGYIYGRVPPQIEYLKEYSLTIQASGSIPTTSTVYSLGITSVNPDAITWVSSSTLSINQGLISELSILATHTETQSILEYGFASTTAIFLGGFTLTNTGNIVGQATTPGIFTATVVAFPVINLDGGPANQPHDLTVSGGSAVSVYEGDELETVTKSVTTTYESIITGGTSLVSGTVTLDGGSATLVGTTVTDGGNVSSTFIVTTTIQETVTVVVTSPTGALLDGGTVSSTYNSTASGGTSKLKFIEIPHDTDGGASASIHNTINDPDTDGGSSISVYEFGNIVDGGDTNSSYTYYDTNGGYAVTVFSNEDPVADGGPAQIASSLVGPVYPFAFSTQDITINVLPSSNTYTGIYVRPFLSIPKRKSYLEFMSSTTVFPANLLYRGDDPNFGVQKDLKMFLEFGIQTLNLNQYTSALYENFNRRRLTFGSVKVARAKDQLGNYLYDVVYVDIVDNIAGVKPTIYDNNSIYYPASLDNMRTQLESIVLPNYSYISVDQYRLPKFMQTAQSGTYLPTNYITVVPLCYVQPGKSSIVVDQIKLSKFDFKLYDFEIDRLIIQDTLDYATAKYIIFPRRSLTSVIPQDQLIFVDPTTSTSFITDDSGNSLLRD